MTCMYCGKNAWYQVGRKGYCKEHADKAKIATRREQAGVESESDSGAYTRDELEARRQERAVASGWHD